MLVEHFKNDLFVLDGGLATELERNGFSLQNNPLWSASLLHKNPEAILKVHKSYLESGADIILTASYQANIKGFQKYLGLTVEDSKNLLKFSAKLAKKAKDDFGSVSKGGKEILIAGSIGSYGAALADGSEYTGNYCDNITHEELMEWHRPHVQLLVDAGVDLLAFETVPAQKEAEAVAKLLNEFPNSKAWISLSCQSLNKTAHGEDVGKAAEACARLNSPNQLVAIGVNCCSLELAESALQEINAVLPDYPLIVYPNSGEVWNTHEGWSGQKAKPNSSYLEKWVKANAKIIGGCCRTTPDDIADIYKFVQNKRSSNQ